MPGPIISKYALCDPEDVKDFLGWDDLQYNARSRTVIRAINSAARAIPRRAQREFLIPDAEKTQTRYVQIVPDDIRRGYVRVGDLRGTVTAAKLWTPDRDTSFDYDVDADLILLPDTPVEPGFPYEYVWIKRTAANQPVNGWWLMLTADWGFPEIPDDIVQIAIGTAASWVLNDVMKLTELAKQAGRKIKFESLIPEEFQDAVDDYRLYRVA